MDLASGKFCLYATVWLMTAATATSARAALPIDLEVATEPGLALTAPQQWAAMLGKLDLGKVRIRGLKAGELPRIEKVKSGSSHRYRVLAILSARGELVFPDRRFRVSQRAAIQDYLQRLTSQVDAQPRGRFDLTRQQFTDVFAQLSKPVDQSTQDKPLSEVIGLLEPSLGLPTHWTSTTRSYAPAKLSSELRGLSGGTALAIALRAAGLSFRPEESQTKRVRLVIEPYRAESEIWPVGWKSEAVPRQFAPQLYRAKTIEIGRNTLSHALKVLQPRLEMPMILDQWYLAKKKIEPDKIDVRHKRKKTYLKGAIDGLLSQARLVGELRVDEQGTPFLWVTQYGKESPRAAK